ncbi:MULTISPECIES: tryptophan halogenase family protein [unclassified Roseateles]|uniref:tryptophan halogenase family protein n=1 Tax=unclassified Roseateles TaxID=2626991 RepID=UPI0006FAD368|nr:MULTISPECIES: tryptophan halogenase family protein [unclassified Roseateles]KQW46583.1 tryptophan halogenase [Pelomonas sp. Root405]KRA73634.1 tryptophan halogenase [Pelomonas sp. Root662]
MTQKRRILIVGGGTAGWLTAAYLAKALRLPERSQLEVTVLESPDISSVGVGEGTFPTIRSTLQFLGIDEARFIRETSATMKQGIRFVDWARAPVGGSRHEFFHPFEAPFYAEDLNLVPYWLLQDEADRAPFAQAMTIQHRVAEGQRAPKRAGEAPYAAPLNYAYHFDAIKLAKLLAERARELGVRHVQATVTGVALDAAGAIAHLDTDRQGRFESDLYIDCSGFRAELIGRALGSPLKSARGHLFADRALACKIPLGAEAVMESATIATAHEAGWLWEIGLNGARGVGCVYSSDHLSDDRAADILRNYCGAGSEDLAMRSIPFAPGYREQQWMKNCVAVGLSAGFLEPLEATGLVLIEAAVGMIAEMLPHSGPIQAPARRFNELMTARFENIINFLKLHYCLSQREEPFWRDNAAPASIPDRLAGLLEEWKLRPPGRFDFLLDTETFAFFNYQYILYGMGFRTDLSAGRDDFTQVEDAQKLFAKIQRFADRAVADLPSHRTLIQQINAGR